MRICLYNPHTCLSISLFSFIFNFKNREIIKRVDKYGYLLDIARGKKYDSAIVIDGTSTSLTSGSSLMKFTSNNYYLLRLVTFFEVYIWCLINRVNPFTTRIIFRFNKLNEDTDVLLGFGFLSDTFLNEKVAARSFFRKFQGRKVIHLSHFFSRTGKVAEAIKKTGTTLAVSEADLKKSDYFDKYFSFIKKVHILPFILREKYKKRTDFQSRKNICLALGTLVMYETRGLDFEDVYKDHFEFFGLNTLQPMRKSIYENRNNLGGLIESFIQPQKIKTEGSGKKDNSLKKTAILIKYLFLHMFGGSKNKYHSFDIVEAYNKYKMFVAPEENIGLPSINFIEGMACGCAYLGLNSPMYQDLGFVDGANYIAYDGTLDNLKEKIRYYQNHEEDLSRIAQAGYEFVRKNFNKEKVIDDFLKEIFTKDDQS